MERNRRRELFRTVKFALFSASAGVIELGSFSLLNELFRAPYWTSYLTALVLSVLWNFTLNRRYTFQSASNVPAAMAKVFGFYCVFTPVSTIGGNYLAGTAGWNPYLVTGLNMACNLVTEYLFDKYVVYRRTMDTNDLAQRQLAKAGQQKESGGQTPES